jgi:hypothetical protein
MKMLNDAITLSLSNLHFVLLSCLVYYFSWASLLACLLGKSFFGGLVGHFEGLFVGLFVGRVLLFGDLVGLCFEGFFVGLFDGLALR